MGTYTEMENVKLPYNRSPRKSEAVDFSGEKFHHSIQSFLVLFWKASNVKTVNYFYKKNRYFLWTMKQSI